MRLREPLEAGNLEAAVSWLLRERRSEIARFPELLGALEGEGSAPDAQQLGCALAAYLLLTGDHDAARLAYSLGAGADAKSRVLETCHLVGDPGKCYELASPAPEEDRSYALEPVALAGPDRRPASLGSLRVARLERGCVYGLTFLPVSAEKKACLKWFVHNSNYPYKLLHAEGMESIPIATVNSLMGSFAGVDDFGEAILVGNVDNIGHWLLNHLGRLALVGSSPKLKDLPLVVGENITARQLECLERFGYPESRLIRLRKGRLARFEVLWAPMMPYCSEGWSPAILDFLRRGFGVEDRPQGRRRLYLTRRNSRWRRLLNEEAVSGLLSDRGFEPVDPGGLSIADQLRLAAGAEVIAGVCGAAMNLALFAPRQTKVIEFHYRRPNMQKMNMTPVLCSWIGQPYEVVLGIPSVSGANPLNYDFTLSPERVKRMLNRAGIHK